MIRSKRCGGDRPLEGPRRCPKDSSRLWKPAAMPVAAGQISYGSDREFEIDLAISKSFDSSNVYIACCRAIIDFL